MIQQALHRFELWRKDRDTPDAIDDRGTAASRSTTYATGWASRFGAYCVVNSAMPTAIGTAMTMASKEMMTVTQSRSTTPKRSVDPSTLQSREKRKFDLSSAIAGAALTIRKIVISAIRMTTNAPEPAVRPWKTRSPTRTFLRGVPGDTGPAPNTGGVSSIWLTASGCADPITVGVSVELSVQRSFGVHRLAAYPRWRQRVGRLARCVSTGHRLSL